MTEGISALLGLFMPILTELMNKHINFPSEAQTKFYKQLIAVAVSFAIGFLVAFFTGQLDWTNVMLSVGIIYGLSNITYKQYFQPKFGAKK